jgi:hypothetical protein
MARLTIALVLLVSSLANAQTTGALKLGRGIQLTDGSSLAVAPANQARLRYHLGNARLEYSVSGGAWSAFSGGGGGYALIKNGGSSLTARTTLHCDGTLIVCSDDAGNSETDITLGSTVVTESSTDTLTNKTLTAPVLSGTATGTYTLGGTPTIGADTTLSAGVDINGSSTSDITMRSFKPSSAAPSISAGAFLGTTPTGLALSTGSNAHAGEITWTQGTSSPTSGDYFTVTPPITASNGWSVLFFPCNDNLALKWLQFSNGLALKIVSTTTTWTLNVVSETALADGATYCMRYLAFPY